MLILLIEYNELHAHQAGFTTHYELNVNVIFKNNEKYNKYCRLISFKLK